MTISAIASLDEVRLATGLDLVSAKEVKSGDGLSYHDKEKSTESTSHRLAREHAVKYFVSLGYQVFPEGVGIRGVYTLADFLAYRIGRVVFVEILTDSNVTEATLARKAQLQSYGELCFVLMDGTNRARSYDLREAKFDVETWADVLRFQLDGYLGNSLAHSHGATVAYETTRTRGIEISLGFEGTKKKVGIAVKFLTHLYDTPMGVPDSICLPPRSHYYEQVYLELFGKLASELRGSVRYSSINGGKAYKAMRRKAGLQMTGDGGRVIARLKSEYRGVTALKERAEWSHHPSTWDLPADDCFGVFLCEDTGVRGLHSFLAVLKESNFVLKYDQEALGRAETVLEKQTGVTLD